MATHKHNTSQSQTQHKHKDITKPQIGPIYPTTEISSSSSSSNARWSNTGGESNLAPLGGPRSADKSTKFGLPTLAPDPATAVRATAAGATGVVGACCATGAAAAAGEAAAATGAAAAPGAATAPATPRVVGADAGSGGDGEALPAVAAAADPEGAASEKTTVKKEQLVV